MATISKFYLLDAVSPNTGIMPSNSPAAISHGTPDGNATGASTARDATDVIGASNPDLESSITSNATTVQQIWGHRRFVSRPLAAQTINDGTWTFSYARSESSLNHNQSVSCRPYYWRPSTGFQDQLQHVQVLLLLPHLLLFILLEESLNLLWLDGSIIL